MGQFEKKLGVCVWALLDETFLLLHIFFPLHPMPCNIHIITVYLQLLTGQKYYKKHHAFWDISKWPIYNKESIRTTCASAEHPWHDWQAAVGQWVPVPEGLDGLELQYILCLNTPLALTGFPPVKEDKVITFMENIVLSQLTAITMTIHTTLFHWG